MTNGAELSGLEAWQLCHRAPYADGISEQTYSRLFNDIALNESAVQQYFMTRANTPTEKRKVLAVESSTVDTYGAGQIEARHGFSKESNNLPSVKLLRIMEVNSLQPLAFHAQPGNVPDVLSIKNTLKQLDCLMERTPLVVTDCGFTSEENLLDFVRHSIPTLTRMKLSTSWIREAFDEIKEEITKHANACPFDTFTFGVTKTVKHEFQILRQRTRGQYRMGDVQILPRNLHIHFFYDDEKATADRAAFRSELKQLKGLVENGETLNKAGQQKVERFFFVKETSKGKVVEFNDEAIHEYQTGHGFFVLISNTEKNTWEALRYYRLREKIEELFAAQKHSMVGRRSRVWTPERLRGRQFVQFVGLGYCFFFLNELKKLKARLGVDDGTKSAVQLKNESKLRSWLENKTLLQILQWFDAVYAMQVETPYGKRTITTETTARDELFLRELGITLVPEDRRRHRLRIRHQLGPHGRQDDPRQQVTAVNRRHEAGRSPGPAAPQRIFLRKREGPFDFSEGVQSSDTKTIVQKMENPKWLCFFKTVFCPASPNSCPSSRRSVTTFMHTPSSASRPSAPWA